MDERTAQVEFLKKMVDFCRKTQSLKPAWLRESGEAVGAYAPFIWGKGTRQRPHINGSGQRPTLAPNHPLRVLIDFSQSLDFLGQLPAIPQNQENLGGSYKIRHPITMLERELESLKVS